MWKITFMSFLALFLFIPQVTYGEKVNEIYQNVLYEQYMVSQAYEYNYEPGYIYTMYDDFDFNGEKELLLVRYGELAHYIELYDKNGLVEKMEVHLGTTGQIHHSINIARGKTGIYINVYYLTEKANSGEDPYFLTVDYYKYKDGKLIKETSLVEEKTTYRFDSFAELSKDGIISLDNLPKEVLVAYNNGQYKEDTYTYYEKVTVNDKPVSVEEYNKTFKLYNSLNWFMIISGYGYSDIEDIEGNFRETVNQISEGQISKAKIPDLGENILSEMTYEEYDSLFTWLSYVDPLFDEGYDKMRSFSTFEKADEDTIVKIMAYPTGLSSYPFTSYEQTNNGDGWTVSVQEMDAVLTALIGNTLSESFKFNSNIEAASVQKQNGRYLMTVEETEWYHKPIYEPLAIYELESNLYLVDYNIHNIYGYQRLYDDSIYQLKEANNELTTHKFYAALSEQQKKSLIPTNNHYAIVKKNPESAPVPWTIMEIDMAKNFDSVERHLTKESPQIIKAQESAIEEQALQTPISTAKETTTTSNYSGYIIAALAGALLAGTVIYIGFRKRK